MGPIAALALLWVRECEALPYSSGEFTSFFFMPRRRYYRTYRNKAHPWSIERTAFRLQPPAPFQLTASIPVISPLPFEGCRTVKNISIVIVNRGSDIGSPEPPADQRLFSVQDQIIYYYALVFVPDGYEPQDLRVPDDSDQSPAGRVSDFYNANQYVIVSGLTTITSSPRTIKTRLARKLHSGDSIALLIRPVSLDDTLPSQFDFIGTVTYALKFN